MEGVDYSFSKPSPTCLANAGRRFAVRYVGTSSTKNLSPQEAAALKAAKVDIVAVYQTTANFMLTASGITGAQRAHSDAVRCGMPEGRPIYFALDTDPNILNSSQWNAVKNYLDQAASVLGRNRVGIYAGWRGIERAVGGGWCKYGWQTYAWSGGKLSAHADLFQYKNGVSLCGGTVDLCKSLADDFGQWSYKKPAPKPQPKPEPKPEPEEDEMKVYRVKRPDWGGHPIHYTDLRSFIWSTRVDSEYDKLWRYLTAMDGKDPEKETIPLSQTTINAMYDEFPITKRDDLGVVR